MIFDGCKIDSFMKRNEDVMLFLESCQFVYIVILNM